MKGLGRTMASALSARLARRAGRRRRRGAGSLFALALCALTGACGGADPANEPLRVASAADLRYALLEVLAAFERLHPDLDVEASFGSSGQFFAQLREGAPFDLFLSADAAYPRQLERAGLLLAGSRFSYAHGRLALWVPRESPLAIEELGLAALLGPAARRVAIASERHAPYGRAAREALERAGVLPAVEERLVRGENVAQAAQLVASGAADAGVIALSLALAPSMVERGRHVVLPEGLYAPLRQEGCVLARTGHPGAARLLAQFLAGPRARAILARWGFADPRDPRER